MNFYYYRYFFFLLKFIGYFPAFQRIINIGRAGWFYPILIFLLISFPTVSTAVQFALEGRQILLASLCFYAMIPIQFILGLRYIRKPHFRSIIVDSHKDLSPYELPKQAKLLIGIVLTTVIVFGINVAIWVHDGNSGAPEAFPHGFDYLIKGIQTPTIKIPINDTIPLTNTQIHQQNAVIALMFFYWIYGWLIMITNLSMFCIILAKHLNDITELKEYIEDDLIWKMDQTSFTDLTRKIISLRFVVNQSIDHLESFYTIATILGAVAIGPIFETKQADPFLIYDIAKYALLQVIFLYFIYTIPKAREDILKIIKSPTVMFKYLTNIKSMQNVQALREAQDMASDSEEIARLNQCKIAAYSPVTLNKLDTIKRAQIIEIMDHPDSIPLRPLNHPQFADALSERLNNSEKLDFSDSCTSVLAEGNPKSPQKPDIESSAAELELLTLSYKNNAAIDWIILQSTLSEKWASFNLLGVSFDNTDVIKKGMGVISLIILGSSYINSLNIL